MKRSAPDADSPDGREPLRRVLRSGRSNADQHQQECERLLRARRIFKAEQRSLSLTGGALIPAVYLPKECSVLVKCLITNSMLAQKNVLLVTVPIDNYHITIKQLEAKLADKVSGLLASSLGGPSKLWPFKLSWYKAACKPTQQLDYFLPDHQPLIFTTNMTHSVPCEQNVVAICIKTLSGKTIVVYSDTAELVADIKLKIQEREGVPPDQQRLIFMDQTLEDNMALQFYNIKWLSTIQLLLRLRGGNPNFSFADVSDDSNLEKHQWSSKAPAWRSAAPGLCVEGYCCNNHCEAYSQMVICNKGMCLFDLILDASTVSCPVCGSRVQPETCAFNQCDWRYVGIKAGDIPEFVQSVGWTVAGNQYERFSSEGGAKVNWERLLISVYYPMHCKGEAFNSECPICLDRFPMPWESEADPVLVTQCGHKYHGSCMEAWKKTGKSSCPLCVGHL